MMPGAAANSEDLNLIYSPTVAVAHAAQAQPPCRIGPF
jgi:hypothetical protein